MTDIQNILHGLDQDDSDDTPLFDELLDKVDFNNPGMLEEIEALLEEILGDNTDPEVE